MTTPVEKVDQLTQQIRFLETLQQLNDLLSEIRERIDGVKDLETWLGEEGTGTMINNLKGLLLALQSEMLSIPKFIAKLDAGISAAGQITAGVDAITRMVRAIETAQTSTGAQKVEDFGELFSDWTTLLGAIGYILEGFSLNPIIGVYFMILGKAISAIAISLGKIEEATKATNEAIRISRGFDPKIDTSAEDAAAEQRRQIQALIDDLKRQREAVIDEFDLKAFSQVDAVIAATLASMGISLFELDRLKTPLSAARLVLADAWDHLQDLITRKQAITASGGSADEAAALDGPIEEAGQALAEAYEAYNMHLGPVKRYVDAIRVADGCGYDVIVVDSLSHAWTGKDGALAMVDSISKRSRSGSSFNAWRDVTPEHNGMVDAILRSRGHVIVTMRTKTEYVLEKDDRTGKTRPKKIGLAPVQRDGLEYEFDVVGDIDNDHSFLVTKSRCSAVENAFIEKPGREFAETLRDWLTDGVDEPEKQRLPTREEEEEAEAETKIKERMEIPEVLALFDKLGTPMAKKVNGVWDRRNKRVKAVLKYTNDKLIDVLEGRVKKAEAEAEKAGDSE